MFPHSLFPQAELEALRKLDTPSKIQDYLDSIPFNFEKSGETCMSPFMVLRTGRAHCLEGGMLAAAALWLQGRKPLILNLKVDKRDDDHVVALYQENGYWGAISKTNHAVLRYRDPVYRSVRELAMSYFHEYFLVRDGRKTMLGFSNPINLRRFGTRWVMHKEQLWHIAEAIYDGKHIPAVPVGNKTYIRTASKVERKAASVSEN